MTPLPPPLGGGPFVGWRLDARRHAETWHAGVGAFLAGGRWNSKGFHAVYAALDPATAILEVAVHKGFDTLDTVPHVLTGFSVLDPAAIHVVMPGAVPNPAWLQAGTPGAGQQQFGDRLLAAHRIFVIPSVVSARSWNLVFDPRRFVAPPDFRPLSQDAFSLDPRLNPPRA